MSKRITLDTHDSLEIYVDGVGLVYTLTTSLARFSNGMSEISWNLDDNINERSVDSNYHVVGK